MDIVVLSGGLSTERDVSFVSGLNVTNALRRNGHRVIMLDVFLGIPELDVTEDIFERACEISYHPDSIKEQAPDIEAVKKLREDGGKNFFGPNVLALCERADIVFMALHGENGENGKVQAALDLFGIKYTGTGYLSSALAMDKNIAKTIFKSFGIPTPLGCGIKEKVKVEELGLNYPVVVKPCSGGSSVGVSIVFNDDEYAKALDEVFSYESEAIVEEYIKGREFSVGVIDGKALPIIEIAPVEGFYDYKNKYKAGSAIETCPALLDECITNKMQYYAEQVFIALQLETYARMDFLLQEGSGNIYCLEANTLPGMTQTSLLPQEAMAIGVTFDQLCEEIINISMKKGQ